MTSPIDFWETSASRFHEGPIMLPPSNLSQHYGTKVSRGFRGGSSLGPHYAERSKPLEQPVYFFSSLTNNWINDPSKSYGDLFLDPMEICFLRVQGIPERGSGNTLRGSGYSRSGYFRNLTHGVLSPNSWLLVPTGCSCSGRLQRWEISFEKHLH